MLSVPHVPRLFTVVCAAFVGVVLGGCSGGSGNASRLSDTERSAGNAVIASGTPVPSGSAAAISSGGNGSATTEIAPPAHSAPTETAIPNRPVGNLSGRIVFERYLNKSTLPQIHIMNADGTNVIRLSNNNFGDGFPVLSPSGDTVVFWRYVGCVGPPELTLMNSDGSGNERILTTHALYGRIAFSPDGQKVVFATENGLRTVDVNSGLEKQLTWVRGERGPSYSRDGSKIVFESGGDVWIANASGDVTGTNLTQNPEGSRSGSPGFSADGRTILFRHETSRGTEIRRMNANGTAQQTIRINHALAPEMVHFPVVSRDGTRIVFSATRYTDAEGWSPDSIASGEGAIYSADWNGGDVQRLTNTASYDMYPSHGL